MIVWHCYTRENDYWCHVIKRQPNFPNKEPSPLLAERHIKCGLERNKEVCIKSIIRKEVHFLTSWTQRNKKTHKEMHFHKLICYFVGHSIFSTSLLPGGSVGFMTIPYRCTYWVSVIEGLQRRHSLRVNLHVQLR